MKVIFAKNKNFDKLLDNLLSKRKNKLRSDYISVKNIIKDVRKNGDKALVKYEKRFNKNKTIIPNSKKIKDSIKSLDQKVKKAIDAAYNRIYKFHSLQKFKDVSYIDKYQNKVKYKYVPLESVAIYVPGSKVSYPSSVLMSTIPAIVAGVKRIVITSPANNNTLSPEILVAANAVGISEIYKVCLLYTSPSPRDDT